MGIIMNRKLLGMAATALAYCSILSCSDKASEITGVALNDSAVAEARLVAVKPSSVTDLKASLIGSTSVTLSFVQVNDGTGQPAKYDVRYAVAPISWGSATSATSGTCTAPGAGTAIGSQVSCTFLGLTPATNYDFELVPYRGTLNLNAVFGSLSNIVSAATTASAPPPPVPVASVTVAPESPSVPVGAAVQLSVTAYDANHNVLTGRTVTSSSADPAIASVNPLGLVSAVSVGTTPITVTSEGKSDTATITVTPPAAVPVASVSVSPTSSSLVVGATVQLAVTAFDANNNVLTGRVVTSSSANPAIASVNSLGLVTAVSVGATQITVMSEGKSAIATITVTAPAPVPVASVAVSPTSSSLIIGATAQLSATTRDAGNNILTGRVVTWSSANAGIATVSSSGLVRAVSAGTTQVTATSEGKTSSATITVTAPAPVPVATVVVSPSSSSLLVGASAQLSATTRDASNNVLTGRVVTWSSANPGIASVSSSGFVSAVGAGTTQITATSEGKTGSATIISTANAPPSGSSNEPSGMALLKQRSFNSLQEDASWDTDNSLSIIQDAGAPKSPSNVIRGTYRSGSSGGTSPGHAGTIHSGSRVLYISYWGKLSANFFGHLTGVNKQLYEWANGVSPFYFEFGGVGTGTLTPQIVLQGTPTDGIYRPNLVPSSHVTRGQWFHVEIVLTGNTSGSRNGVADWWLDGVHVGSLSGLQFTSSTTSWNTFEFRPVWGGVGDVVPSTMTLDWDHVYISGKN
jgi:uncharacterized protein YjdB